MSFYTAQEASESQAPQKKSESGQKEHGKGKGGKDAKKSNKGCDKIVEEIYICEFNII